MGLLTWMVAGALLGGAASAMAGTRDWRVRILDVAAGVAGVVSGGWLLGEVIGASAFGPGEFSIESLLVSLLGAAALLTALHTFRSGGEAARRQEAPDPVGMSGSGNAYAMEETGTTETSAGTRAAWPWITAGLAGVILLVGGCATAPTAPESALDAARVAISNAEKAEAGRYAGAELGEAREKLALADKAVRDEDMVAAGRLALESQVEAELASARTASAKARAINEEMERGADALAEEMQRTGEQK